MSYKIQNRSPDSKRIKIIKRTDGKVLFTGAPVPTFQENTIQAGWCLIANSPVPELTQPSTTFELTASPIGVDGRVSLYRNETLVSSMRYNNLSSNVDKVKWFNDFFGAVVLMAIIDGVAVFTIREAETVVKLVFEDDDIDYIFGDFQPRKDNRPAFFREQYRLAFIIMNNKIEISCAGAHYESPNMVMAGDWQLEINDEKYTTLDTPIEQMLSLIAQSEVGVVYEGEEPEPEEEVITDYTLTGWYNPDLQRFEGFARPTEKVMAVIAPLNGEPLDILNDIIIDAQGRWNYPHTLADVSMFGIVTYRGDLADPDNVIYGEQVIITDFTLPTYRKANADTIPTYAKEMAVTGDGHFFFKIGNGEIQKEQIPLGSLFSFGESVNLNMVLASFADADGLESGVVGPLGKFFMMYTNSLGLLRRYTEVIEPTFVDFTFLSPKPGRISLPEPVTVTLYRGLSKDSTDLFSVLFPNAVENYITFTATACVDPSAFAVGTPSLATTNNEVLQFCDSPFGNSIRVINATDIDNLTSVNIAAKDFLPKTGYVNVDVDYSKMYKWYMNYNETGNQLAISVNEKLNSSNNPNGLGDRFCVLVGFNRTGPATFETIALTEINNGGGGYPTISNGLLGWYAGPTYHLYEPQPSGSYSHLKSLSFSDPIAQMYQIRSDEQFIFTHYWDGSSGKLGYKLKQVTYDPLQDIFTVVDSLGFIPNENQQGPNALNPVIVNITDTESVVTIAGKLVLLKKAPVEGDVKFTILEDTADVRGVVEVDRNDTEVFMIITNGSARTYRFVAMSVTDLSMREISSGSLDEIGGMFGRNVGKAKTVFMWDHYPTTLTFSTFNLESGLIKSVVFRPK